MHRILQKALSTGIIVAMTALVAWGQPSPRILELLEQPAGQRFLNETTQTEAQKADWLFIFRWARSPFKRTQDTRLTLWPAVKRNPTITICSEVLKDLPDDPEVDAFFYSQLSQLPYAEKARVWLRRRGRFLRDELIQAATQASDEDLRILARLDPAAARKVLDKLGTLAPHQMLVLAVEVQMDPARVDLRRRLETVATDAHAPADHRQMASHTLSSISWPGQLQFMRNLAKIPGNSYILEDWAKSDPDRWVPVLKTWLSDKDLQLHNLAVDALLEFHGEDHREDALRALLPWLSNARWSNSRGRLLLIQSLDRFECPEAVPDLIQIVSSPGDDYERSYAAVTLAHYRDPRAVPAMRQAFLEQTRAHHREHYLQGLIACGAYPLEMQAKAVEVYAQLLLRHGEQARYTDKLLEGDELTALGAFLGRAWSADFRTTALVAVVNHLTAKNSRTPLACKVSDRRHLSDTSRMPLAGVCTRLRRENPSGWRPSLDGLKHRPIGSRRVPDGRRETLAGCGRL